MKKVTIAILVAMLLLTACATTYMRVPVKKPANINLAGVNKLAIGEISGKNAQDVADALTMALFNCDRYEVLDRKNLDMILQEHDLTMSGLVNESTAVKVGELIGNAALIFGRVTKYDYADELTFKDEKDKNGKSYRSYWLTGNAVLGINLQITDLRTGKIIAVRNYLEKAEKTNYAENQRPANIETAPLFKKAQDAAIAKFMKDIAPYTVYESVSLLEEKEIPQLKQGIAMVKVGDWRSGIEYFEEACKTNPQNAKAFYDLGVAYQYTHQFDKAIEALKKAYAIEPKSKYSNQISSCNRLKREQEELKKQLEQAKG